MSTRPVQPCLFARLACATYMRDLHVRRNGAANDGARRAQLGDGRGDAAGRESHAPRRGACRESRGAARNISADPTLSCSQLSRKSGSTTARTRLARACWSGSVRSASSTRRLQRWCGAPRRATLSVRAYPDPVCVRAPFVCVVVVVVVVVCVGLCGHGGRRGPRRAQAHLRVHDVQLFHASDRPGAWALPSPPFSSALARATSSAHCRCRLHTPVPLAGRELGSQDALHVGRERPRAHRLPWPERRSRWCGSAALAVLRRLVRQHPRSEGTLKRARTGLGNGAREVLWDVQSDPPYPSARFSSNALFVPTPFRVCAPLFRLSLGAVAVLGRGRPRPAQSSDPRPEPGRVPGERAHVRCRVPHVRGVAGRRFPLADRQGQGTRGRGAKGGGRRAKGAGAREGAKGGEGRRRAGKAG